MIKKFIIFLLTFFIQVIFKIKFTEKFLKKIIINYRFENNPLFALIAKIYFQNVYKNKSPKEMRKITDLTVSEGEGRKWAEKFYNQRYKSLVDLKKRRVGKISAYEAWPLFEGIISLINTYKNQTEKLCLIQLGSCSGADLQIIYDHFPSINCISTDINDEILEFQKEKYQSNFKYFKCHAEDIDKCLINFNLKNKKIILFSCGSLQYLNPYHLEVFFNKMQSINNLDLFICDTVDLDFIENTLTAKSKIRFDIVFNHKYNQYLTGNFEILKNKIIKPFDNNDLKNSNVAHTYLHIKYN